jgi:hypothetical protein
MTRAGLYASRCLGRLREPCNLPAIQGEDDVTFKDVIAVAAAFAVAHHGIPSGAAG